MSESSTPLLTPRRRVSGGCCEAPVVPDLDAEQAVELAAVVKALADPTRLRIVDAVRKSAPEALCQCELLPLFDMSQAGLAKHLRVLVTSGVLASERRGTWTYYFLNTDALRELHAWVS